jgi:hypothetical protein
LSKQEGMSQYSGIAEEFPDDFESESGSVFRGSMISDLRGAKSGNIAKVHGRESGVSNGKQSKGKQEALRASFSVQTFECYICHQNVDVSKLTSHITSCAKNKNKPKVEAPPTPDNASGLIDRQRTSKFYSGSRDTYPDDFTGSYGKFTKSKDSMKNSIFFAKI